MATKNNAPSLLHGFSRFLRSSPNGQNLAMPANPMAKAEVEDDLQQMPHSPYANGVQVMEVDQSEFLKEWGRAVIQKAMAKNTGSEDADSVIDRRLPNFDRRYVMTERRASGQEDRRHGIPWPPGQPRLERRTGIDERRQEDRRAYQGHDRRVPSLILKAKKLATKPVKG
jgi:hypothetical protein